MGFFSARGRARLDSGTRRRVNRTISLTLDSLEDRQLLAAGALGINAMPEYVNLMMSVRDWDSVPGWITPGGVAPALTRDATGWPTSDAGIVVIDDRTNQWWNGPDPNPSTIDLSGTYHLSFKGSATIYPWASDFTLQNQVYNASTNTTTADLVEKQIGSNAFLSIYFTQTHNPQSATGSGVSDVKLIRPGYDPNTTQVFTTNLLNGLSGFDTIRVIDATATNDYGPQTDANGKLVPLDWSQRRLPTASSQMDTYQGKMGQSWEYLVQLANEANSNLWVNVPGPATDDYVRKLAQLIKNGSTVGGVTYPGLKPGLKIYLEYSNEVWGGLPVPASYHQAATRQALATGSTPINNDGTTDMNTLSGRYYLQRTMEVAQIFRSVFGPDTNYDVVRPVAGWQVFQYQFFRDALPWFQTTFGSPNKFFYGIGNANYFWPSGYSSVDEVINSLRAGIPDYAANVASFTAVARFYGLKNVSYEGGPALGAPAGSSESYVALAAARDPRLTSIVYDYYTAMYAAGEDLAMFYAGVYGIWSPQNQWFAAEKGQAANPTASPKYRALRDLLNASPVVVNPGRPVTPTDPTVLPINSDDVGGFVIYPSSGQTNIWLLNVAQAGVYGLTIKTSDFGSTVQPGTVQVLLNDRTVLGTYSITANSTIDLGKLTLPAGVVTLGLKTVRGYNDKSHPENPSYYAFRIAGLTLSPISTTAPPPSGNPSTPGLADAGFEVVSVASTGYRYNPTGSAWNFTGSTGLVYNNVGFSSGFAAPGGSQVAFLQSTAMLSQVVSGWSAGSFTISFAAAKRVYNGDQDFQVLVDGAVVGTFTPSSRTYLTYRTAAFTVSAGSHTITFKGLNSAGGDNTALLDQISIDPVSTTPTPPTPPPSNSVPTIGDSSFETRSVASSGYLYNPTGSPWAFAGSAGLVYNNIGFSSGNAVPSGSQVAFLQGQGSISQVVSGWAVGSYTLSFSAAKRVYAGDQDFQVLVDGVVVGTFAPSSRSYLTYTTSSFNVTAGSHTITFKGLNSAGGDNTALIDQITVAAGSGTTTNNPPPITAPSTGDSGFEAVSVASSGYRYNPTGSPWSFTGSTGLAYQGIGFTSGAATPEGNQVAFLQQTGSISQVISDWSAGSFTISFAAAKRVYAGDQDFQVLVDGAVVGTFTPSSRTYLTYRTAAFTVSAGSHTITFKGLNSAGGDNTALLDQISIAVAS